MKVYFVLMLLFLIACKSKSVKVYTNPQKQPIHFSDQYIVCDTCRSVIIVKHEECTGCGEISVDSGTVYLTTAILKTADTLGYDYKSEDSFAIAPNTVSIRELYFSDTGYFKSLWKSKINPQGLHKRFRLTGKITAIKRRILYNGVAEMYPSLFFKAESAEEVKK